MSTVNFSPDLFSVFPQLSFAVITGSIWLSSESKTKVLETDVINCYSHLVIEIEQNKKGDKYEHNLFIHSDR